MGKRLVQTIKVYIDPKNPKNYTLKVNGNGSMPATDLAICLETVAEHLSKSNGTVEDHFKKNQSNA
jgi:dihydroxyacetone kinase